MSFKYVSQDKKNLSTAFYIPKDSQKHSFANVEEIVINGSMNNSVDFKSNYLAYLTKHKVNNNSTAFFVSECDDKTDKDMYLLNVLRIPVKTYNTKTEIVNELNKSYATSISDIVVKNYVDDSAYVKISGTDLKNYNLPGEGFILPIYGYKKNIDIISGENSSIINAITGYNNSQLVYTSSTSNTNIIKTVDLSSNTDDLNMMFKFQNNENETMINFAIKNNSYFSMLFKSINNDNFSYLLEYYINNDYFIDKSESEYIKTYSNEVISNFLVNNNVFGDYYKNLINFFNVDTSGDQYFENIEKSSYKYLSGVMFDVNDTLTEIYVYFYKNAIRRPSEEDSKNLFQSLELLKTTLYPYNSASNFVYDRFSIVDKSKDVKIYYNNLSFVQAKDIGLVFNSASGKGNNGKVIKIDIKTDNGIITTIDDVKTLTIKNGTIKIVGDTIYKNDRDEFVIDGINNTITIENATLIVNSEETGREGSYEFNNAILKLSNCSVVISENNTKLTIDFNGTDSTNKKEIDNGENGENGGNNPTATYNNPISILSCTGQLYIDNGYPIANPDIKITNIDTTSTEATDVFETKIITTRYKEVVSKIITDFEANDENNNDENKYILSAYNGHSITLLDDTYIEDQNINKIIAFINNNINGLEENGGISKLYKTDSPENNKFVMESNNGIHIGIDEHKHYTHVTSENDNITITYNKPIIDFMLYNDKKYTVRINDIETAKQTSGSSNPITITYNKNDGKSTVNTNNNLITGNGSFDIYSITYTGDFELSNKFNANISFDEGGLTINKEKDVIISNNDDSSIIYNNCLYNENTNAYKGKCSINSCDVFIKTYDETNYNQNLYYCISNANITFDNNETHVTTSDGKLNGEMTVDGEISLHSGQLQKYNIESVLFSSSTNEIPIQGTFNINDKSVTISDNSKLTLTSVSLIETKIADSLNNIVSNNIDCIINSKYNLSYYINNNNDNIVNIDNEINIYETYPCANIILAKGHDNKLYKYDNSVHAWTKISDTIIQTIRKIYTLYDTNKIILTNNNILLLINNDSKLITVNMTAPNNANISIADIKTIYNNNSVKILILTVDGKTYGATIEKTTIENNEQTSLTVQFVEITGATSFITSIYSNDSYFMATIDCNDNYEIDVNTYYSKTFINTIGSDVWERMIIDTDYANIKKDYNIIDIYPGKDLFIMLDTQNALYYYNTTTGDKTFNYKNSNITNIITNIYNNGTVYLLTTQNNKIYIYNDANSTWSEVTLYIPPDTSELIGDDEVTPEPISESDIIESMIYTKYGYIFLLSSGKIAITCDVSGNILTESTETQSPKDYYANYKTIDISTIAEKIIQMAIYNNNYIVIITKSKVYLVNSTNDEISNISKDMFNNINQKELIQTVYNTNSDYFALTTNDNIYKLNKETNVWQKINMFTKTQEDYITNIITSDDYLLVVLKSLEIVVYKNEVWTFTSVQQDNTISNIISIVSKNNDFVIFDGSNNSYALNESNVWTKINKPSNIKILSIISDTNNIIAAMTDNNIYYYNNYEWILHTDQNISTDTNIKYNIENEYVIKVAVSNFGVMVLTNNNKTYSYKEDGVQKDITFPGSMSLYIDNIMAYKNNKNFIAIDNQDNIYYYDITGEGTTWTKINYNIYSNINNIFIDSDSIAIMDIFSNIYINKFNTNSFSTTTYSIDEINISDCYKVKGYYHKDKDITLYVIYTGTVTDTDNNAYDITCYMTLNDVCIYENNNSYIIYPVEGETIMKTISNFIVNLKITNHTDITISDIGSIDYNGDLTTSNNTLYNLSSGSYINKTETSEVLTFNLANGTIVKADESLTINISFEFNPYNYVISNTDFNTFVGATCYLIDDPGADPEDTDPEDYKNKNLSKNNRSTIKFMNESTLTYTTNGIMNSNLTNDLMMYGKGGEFSFILEKERPFNIDQLFPIKEIKNREITDFTFNYASFVFHTANTSDGSSSSDKSNEITIFNIKDFNIVNLFKDNVLSTDETYVSILDENKISEVVPPEEIVPISEGTYPGTYYIVLSKAEVNNQNNKLNNIKLPCTIYQTDTVIKYIAQFRIIGTEITCGFETIVIDKLTDFAYEFDFTKNMINSLIKYNAPNSDINNYTILNKNNKFAIIFSRNFSKFAIENTCNLITNYKENEVIEFSREIIPVRLEMNGIEKINSPLKNNEKAALALTDINKPMIKIKDNEIETININNIKISHISNNSYYTSFNCSRSNVMDIISIPLYTVKANINNLFNINGKVVPMIKGNKMISYLYTDNNIISNSTNENIDLQNVTPITKINIKENINFFNSLKLNVCFGYDKNIDNVLNNTANYNNIVFNIISTHEYNNILNQYRIPINKNVNLGDNGVYIYITSDKFQWPFNTNLSMMKYSYLE